MLRLTRVDGALIESDLHGWEGNCILISDNMDADDGGFEAVSPPAASGVVPASFLGFFFRFGNFFSWGR